MNRPSIAALVLSLGIQSIAAHATAAPIGIWVTPGFGSKVELSYCKGGDPNTLCGEIIWLWDSVDERGTPQKDTKNPDKERRQSPLVGTKIIWGFKLNNEGTWRGGKLYNPEDGQSYSGSFRLESHDELNLKGCVMRVLCKSQTWRRLDAVMEDAGRSTAPSP
ncbi:MAG: DUF2147 domain-containing protein [Pseudomonadota bacterium]